MGFGEWGERAAGGGRGGLGFGSSPCFRNPATHAAVDSGMHWVGTPCLELPADAVVPWLSPLPHPSPTQQPTSRTWTCRRRRQKSHLIATMSARDAACACVAGPSSASGRCTRFRTPLCAVALLRSLPVCSMPRALRTHLPAACMDPTSRGVHHFKRWIVERQTHARDIEARGQADGGDQNIQRWKSSLYTGGGEQSKSPVLPSQPTMSALRRSFCQRLFAQAAPRTASSLPWSVMAHGFGRGV